jgi:predicted nucleotidyltransferase
MFGEIIARIAPILDIHQIPYVIIGGQAVLVYGEPRLTRDIDISIGVSTDRLPDVMKVLSEARLKPLSKEIEAFVAQTMVLPALDEPTGVRVDFIFSTSSFEIGAMSRARKKEINGRLVNFASPEDLIVHKIVAGREQDLKDAASVILKNSGVDRDYIRKWLGLFDESFEEKDFLKTFEAVLDKTR